MEKPASVRKHGTPPYEDEDPVVPPLVENPVEKSHEPPGAAAPASNGARRGQRFDSTVLVPLIVACALFVQVMDSTIIATSLPMIALDFGKDPVVLKLGLSAYLISLAVFIPISGWISDRFGGRTVFRTSLGVFMVGSVLCGFTHSFFSFVAARFLQGIGGAMMVPVGRIVILRTVPRQKLVSALNTLTAPAMLGPVIGPPVGGLITTYASWRWIFFINIPISVLGIVLAGLFMENYREEEVPPLDWAGFLLSGFGLSLAMFGLSTITDRLMPVKVCVGISIVGAIFMCLYFVHARRKPQPLLNLDFLKIKTFLVGVGGGSLFRIGVGAIALLLPLMFQIGFGLSPFQSGMLTCASAIGAIFMKATIKMVLRVFGFRAVLIYNAIFSSAAIMAYGLFKATTSHLLILTILFIAGCFQSLQFTALNAIPYADIADQDVSPATSLFTTIQQLSLGIGITIGAFALQATSSLRHHQAILADDFGPAFFLLGLIAMTSAYSAVGLPPHAGADLAGRDADAYE
jgi:EmrB/QacA subfamily drug resistance transporter